MFKLNFLKGLFSKVVLTLTLSTGAVNANTVNLADYSVISQGIGGQSMSLQFQNNTNRSINSFSLDLSDVFTQDIVDIYNPNGVKFNENNGVYSLDNIFYEPGETHTFYFDFNNNGTPLYIDGLYQDRDLVMLVGVNGFYDSAKATFAMPIIYKGNYEVTSAVPEPSTYALMLGGLGLVGLFAARRKVSA